MQNKSEILLPDTEYSSNEDIILFCEKILAENIKTSDVLRTLDVYKELTKLLLEKFKSTNQQTKKLIKISDSTQNKLFLAKEKLKAQNDLILHQNSELQKLNDEKDKYLSIINSELQSAFKYVLSLIPQPIDYNSIKTFWRFIPSSALGGDAFGYHWLDKSNISFYLIDVSGHGVGPALHSVSIINLIKNQNLIGVDYYSPESVISELNNSFLMSEHEGLYFTMWYGVYNIETRELKYSGAGHPPALILSGNKEIIRLKEENFVVGAIKNMNYKSDSLFIPSNSNLMIYSDGVYEIKMNNGNMMTIEDLFHFIQNNIDEKGSEIDKLYNYLLDTSSTNNLDDDFSFLRVEIK
jgi:phosphoserine phosphatase RsbU/P